MDDKNNQNPLEIPDNNPQRESKPISARYKAQSDKQKKSRVIKIAYAFAFLLALGGALATKIITEKNLGNLNVPIEQDYITVAPTTENKTTEPDFQVRQNKTDVPDTRNETQTEKAETTTEKKAEPTTEKKLYSTPYKDYYTLPLGTDILKEYLPSTPSYNPSTDDWRTHPAVDFKGAEGSQIKAISYGTVKDIYDDALLGTVVVIDHGNKVEAKYCGLNKDTVEVEKSATVNEGQCIGYLGTVPFEKSELSHLHFEIYYKDKNVDPLELMGK